MAASTLTKAKKNKALLDRRWGLMNMFKIFQITAHMVFLMCFAFTVQAGTRGGTIQFIVMSIR